MLKDNNAFRILILLSCFSFMCGEKHIEKIETLVQMPSKFNHLNVAIQGCYIKEFEKSILGPCVGHSNPENSIWLDSGEYAEALGSIVSDASSKPSLPFPKLTNDEKALYMKLLMRPLGSSTPVVVEGEFQTVNSGGYGTGFKSRLILHRVLKLTTER